MKYTRIAPYSSFSCDSCGIGGDWRAVGHLEPNVFGHDSIVSHFLLMQNLQKLRISLFRHEKKLSTFFIIIIFKFVNYEISTGLVLLVFGVSNVLTTCHRCADVRPVCADPFPNKP